jgi:hypothetical protein
MFGLKDDYMRKGMASQIGSTVSAALPSAIVGANACPLAPVFQG